MAQRVMTKIAQQPNVKKQQPIRAGFVGKATQQARPSLVAVDWSKVVLKEFRKNFLSESTVCKYSDEAISNYFADAEARIGTRLRAKGNVPLPPMKLRCPYFELSETPFPEVLLNELKKEGFEQPLPIQAIAWPYILSGQNFVGVAQGSGKDKTLAYVLPTLVHVNDQLEKAPAAADAKPEDSGPIAVILTDVKKRGEQILEKMKTYGAGLNITSHLVFGGHEKKSQNDPIDLGLKDNPHVVIAALGQKLADLLLSKKLNLKRCSYLVLDDGSRLVKNSHYLKDVLGQIRSDRQIVMWTSAFTGAGTEASAVKILQQFGFSDYVRLCFGSFGHFHNPHSIKQVILPVTETDRQARFVLLVQTILTAASTAAKKKPKTLIFCNAVDKLQRLSNMLLATGLQSRSFITRNPIPDAASTDATKTKDTPPAKTEEAKAEEVKKEEEDAAAEVQPDISDEPVIPPREQNANNMRENAQYHFWLSHSQVPLDELNFAEFDFIINYDFPLAFNLYEQRIAKFREEAGGKGTVYTFLLDTDSGKTSKFLTHYLQEANQYVPAKLYEGPQKPAVATTPGNTQAKTAAGLVQRNRNTGFPMGGRPTPYGGMGPRGGGGNFGRPNFPPFGHNRNMGGGGNGYGAGPRHFGGGNGMGYGGPRNNAGGGGMGFGRGMGGGGPGPRNNDGGGMGFGRGGGMNDDVGGLPDAGVIDALQLLSQLRNKVNAAPVPQKIDIPFYRRDSPPREDFSRDRGNDFGGNRLSQIPFSRNEVTQARGGNSNSMDFASDSVRPNFNSRSDFDSGNRGFSSSFGNSNNSRNTFGGLNPSNGVGGGRGAGGGETGGGWFKEDGSTRRFDNFSSNWKSNF